MGFEKYISPCQKIITMSTRFPHSNIHRYTWNSPDGKTHSKIYHVLVDKRLHSSIIDIRSFTGADSDTAIIWWLQKLETDCK